jgi:hypothetical protein
MQGVCGLRVIIVRDPYVKVKICTILHIIVYHSTLVASTLVKFICKNEEIFFYIFFQK